MIEHEKETTRRGEAYPLLDSSLITESKQKKYTVKSILCGNYTQFYFYPSVKLKKFDEDGLCKGGGYSRREGEGSIEYKNLVRSKNNLARLVMANYDKFKTFVTLTFADNVTDVKYANSVFHCFVNNLKKRVKSDFVYIAVPEFQKRGAIHYHLLTNIDYTDFDVLCKDIKRLYSPSSHKWEIGRPVNSWTKGWSLAQDIISQGYDLIGYLSKYMIKDFDNRLFGNRRYLYSAGLEKPIEKYLDMDNENDVEEIEKILYNSTIRFKSRYVDIINSSTVEFVEVCNSLSPEDKCATSHNT